MHFLRSTPSRSMDANMIRAEGAKHIAEALKSNSTLKQLSYVATHSLSLAQLAVL